MKNLLKHSALTLTFFILGATTIGCGQLTDVLDGSKNDSSSAFSNEDESSKLISDSVNSASGSSEDFLRPYVINGVEGAKGKHEDFKHGAKGRHGPRGGHGSKGIKPPPPLLSALPVEIQTLMKAADAKKDSVLGIDRTKVDEILKNMRTDLEAARSVAASRDDFVAQAKVIQDKYVAQLKTVLPAFDSLTQDQKDRVKAIHDLQKGVIDSCVARGADSASAACTTAKTALQSNIDTP
jgi:hypothetical protein